MFQNQKTVLKNLNSTVRQQSSEKGFYTSPNSQRSSAWDGTLSNNSMTDENDFCSKLNKMLLQASKVHKSTSGSC